MGSSGNVGHAQDLDHPPGLRGRLGFFRGQRGLLLFLLIDTVGGPLLPRRLRSVRPGGRAVAGQFQHLVVAYGVQLACLGNDAGVRGHDSGNILPKGDLARIETLTHQAGDAVAIGEGCANRGELAETLEGPFATRLRELTTRHGMLLIMDEVQSGMGRTGKMFAIEHFGVKPDVVAIAKGIASGLPLSISAARADVMTWPAGAHANTFGGNPLACAAALVTIQLLREKLIANASDVGGYLLDRLRGLADKHQLIGDVRGMGAMRA